MKLVCQVLLLKVGGNTMIGNSIAFLTSLKPDGSINVMTVMPWDRFADDPYYIGISIRPSRFSYECIKIGGKFGIAIPTSNMVKQLNYCGIVSGREINKVKAANLELMNLKGFTMSVIKDCITYYECNFKHEYNYGSHILIVGEKTAKYDAKKNDEVSEKDASVVYYDVGKTWWCLGNKVWEYSNNREFLENTLKERHE